MSEAYRMAVFRTHEARKEVTVGTKLKGAQVSNAITVSCLVNRLHHSEQRPTGRVVPSQIMTTGFNENEFVRATQRGSNDSSAFDGTG
jgi:hypothetical protein